MPSFLLHGPPLRLCMGLVCVLLLGNTVSGITGESKKEKGMTFLPRTVSVLRREERKEKGVAFLANTEVPARSVDLSALNLTELVNGMLSRALKDSKKFFSLLSITSYSSFAFHKFSVAIYNISNLKTVDPARFPTRYCYCLNNRTNDLSDFTALLVDIIGNSTSYLTEIFKSTSILSVSQTNESDCLFICVMAGESGRNLSDFWEMVEKAPVINYTFTSSLSGVLVIRTEHVKETNPSSRTSPGTTRIKVIKAAIDLLPKGAAATREAAGISEPTTQSQQGLPRTGPPHWAHRTHPASALSASPPRETTAPSEGEAAGSTGRLPGPPAGTTATASRASASHPGSGTVTPGTQTPRPTKAPAPKDPQTGDVPAEWPFAPGEEPALIPVPHQVSRCPQPLLKQGAMTAAPLTLATQKLNPCLMELCRFFQQCLCVSQRNPRTETMRYCLEYYSWFLKNATFICQRVKRVSSSHTLKQKCLESICESV
ncbi:HERV-H LTR-associating protein 1 [Urocitellus parryii]